MTQRTSIALRTGDTVKVLTGIDRGKSGKITQVFPRDGRLVVDGVNQRKKNIKVRRTQTNQHGEIITFNAPIPVTNVMLVCPRCSKPTRIGHSMIEGEKKKRVCKKCKQTIDT